MIIKVTQKDIDRGMRGSCTMCPIAVAAGRQNKGLYTFVNKFAINIGSEWFVLPDEAVNFVLAFDCGLDVKPLKFELTDRIDAIDVARRDDPANYD